MSGPLPGYLAPLTVPASWLYERIIHARNVRFDRGVGVQRIDRPVISVGNITTGGTGKTPMVMWIARQLIDAGHKPAIAMRGYKSVEGKSDEQMEYMDRLPGVPVIADPNRFDALRAFLPSHLEIDCVILDDGFQHRQLHRNLDLVLIDATANTFNDRMLPAGHLREPLENLRRADAVIVMHADAVSESEISNLKSQIANYHHRPALALSRHVWSRVDEHHSRNESNAHDVQWLRDKRVLTMIGVGTPQLIINQLQKAGVTIAADIPASDHERYNRAKIAVATGLCGGCDALVVTHKDWVKLRDLIDWSAWPVPIVVPRLELEVFEGADELRRMVLNAVRVGEDAAR